MRVQVVTTSVDQAINKTVRGYAAMGRSATAYAQLSERSIVSSAMRWATSIERAAERARRAYASIKPPQGFAAGGGSGGGGGNSRAAAANSLDALQDRLFKRDMSRRNRYEASLQRQAEAAVTLEATKAARLDQIQDRLLMRDYRRTVRAEQRKAKEAEKTTIAQTKENEKAAAAAIKAAESKASVIASVEDRFVARDYQRRVQAEQRKARETAKNAAEETRVAKKRSEQLELIEARLNVKIAKQRRRAQEQAAKDAEAAASQAATAQTKMATAALTAGVEAADVLRTVYAEIQKRAEAAADATLKAMKLLREVASMKNRPFVSDQDLADSARIRLASGLDANESSEFQKGFDSTVNIGRQIHDADAAKVAAGGAGAAEVAAKGGPRGISKETAEDLSVQAAIRARRRGGDVRTAAELSGMLGAFGPVKSAEQGLGQMETIRQLLVDGTGDDAPLTKQTLQAAATLVREGGPVPDLPGMAAVIAHTSLSTNEGAAGERALLLSRALFRGASRQRKPKGAAESQADYEKRLGIKEGMDLEARLDKVIPDVRKAMDAGRDPEAYLYEHGFSDVGEANAIIQTAIPGRYEGLKEKFAKSRGNVLPNGKAEIQANKDWKATQEGRAAIAEQAKAVAEFTRGIPARSLVNIKAAEESTPSTQAADQTPSTAVGDLVRGALEPGALPTFIKSGFSFAAVGEGGRPRRIEQQATAHLEERARKAGVNPAQILAEMGASDVGARARGLMGSMFNPTAAFLNAVSTGTMPARGLAPQSYQEAASGITDPNFLANYVTRVEGEITKRGGSNAIDTAPIMNDLAKAIRENTAAIKGDTGASAPEKVKPGAQKQEPPRRHDARPVWGGVAGRG